MRGDKHIVLKPPFLSGSGGFFIFGCLAFILAIVQFPGSECLPALALFDAVTQAPVTCICFEHLGEAIESFYFIRNPDKLKNIRYAG